MDSSTQSSYSKDERVNSSIILNEESPPAKPNVYIDIDGKWKLELNDNSLEEESIVDEVNGEEQEETVKWCTPVSVISDDSSSEDEKVKFCKPIHSEGHKFP